MACEALAMLDCTDGIGSWARRFGHRRGRHTAALRLRRRTWPARTIRPSYRASAAVHDTAGSAAPWRPMPSQCRRPGQARSGQPGRPGWHGLASAPFPAGRSAIYWPATFAAGSELPGWSAQRPVL